MSDATILTPEEAEARFGKLTTFNGAVTTWMSFKDGAGVWDPVFDTPFKLTGYRLAIDENDIVYRLRKRAEIRRQIPHRKSVQEGQPDRLADLLEEAATEIEALRGRP